jgi:hypothetical protein
VPGGCLHLEHVALAHAIVKVARWSAGRQRRSVRRRQRPLHGDAVCGGVGPVGQRVAARQAARTARTVRQVLADLQGEGEVLAWLERRQRLAVDWLQGERALAVRRVLVLAAHDPEVTPAWPGARGDRNLDRIAIGQRTGRPALSPNVDAGARRQLEQQGCADDPEELQRRSQPQARVRTTTPHPH